MECEILLDSELVAVVKKTDNRCVKCHMRDEDAEVVSFGLRTPFDVVNTTEVFFWCSCGHKWVEDPDGQVVKVR